MASVKYEYDIIHPPSNRALTKRYTNLGNALNRIEQGGYDADYLAECVVREHRIERTVDATQTLSDVYDFAPGQTAYLRTWEKRPCTQCNGNPPNGFECKKCSNTGEMDVAVGKPITLSKYHRKSGKRYGILKKRATRRRRPEGFNPDDLYATQEDAEDA